MPNLPKWVVDSIENLLPSKYLNTTINSITSINAEIKKIAFTANLDQVAIYPSYAVVFRVGPNDLRHYTISAFDRQAGTFEILFHTHGKAPGSDWVTKLQAGDRIKMTIPVGRRLYDQDKQHHFFFGDETSLSFYTLLMKEINENGQNCSGILELRKQNTEVPAKLGFEVVTVLKTPENPGKEAIAHLNSLSEQEAAFIADCNFYLSGNVASVQEFRKNLKRIGIKSKNIKLQGYWAEGRIGL